MVHLQSHGRAIGALLFLCFLARPSAAALVLSEVFYDAVGGDNGLVFVELFGDPGQSLDGLVLEGINGSGGGVTHSVALSGLMPADGVFVLADDDGSGATQVANADLIAEFDLQNGPDSVVLRMDAQVLDALGFGDFTSAIFAGEGTPAPDVAAGSSLARSAPWLDADDNAADFQVLATPTPGIVPLAPMAVPAPPALWLLLSGVALLGGLGRRRALDASGMARDDAAHRPSALRIHVPRPPQPASHHRWRMARP